MSPLSAKLNFNLKSDGTWITTDDQSPILKLKVGIAHDKKCIWILILKQSFNLVIDDALTSVHTAHDKCRLFLT